MGYKLINDCKLLSLPLAGGICIPGWRKPAACAADTLPLPFPSTLHTQLIDSLAIHLSDFPPRHPFNTV